jgi:hypothetical protein
MKNKTAATTLIYFVTLCCTVGLLPFVRAVCNEGCLDTGNTVFGEDALANLTSGGTNTAVGLQTLNANTSGSNNTALGWEALQQNTTGDNNTSVGYYSLLSNHDGLDNTAVGSFCLSYNASGSNNTAVGEGTMESNAGDDNTAIGRASLVANANGSGNTVAGSRAMTRNNMGSNNTALGASALTNNTTGDTNIAVGFAAGRNLTTGSNNIDVGNSGRPGESNTIRIGRAQDQVATFVAGISGATVPTGVAVIIDADGHLGTTTSSARFKEAIKPMDKASETILELKPVTFRYKHELDPAGVAQFGLVAEEVAKVNPDLVARDEEGKPYTVRYEAVNAMLLNEFLKEHRKNEEQQAVIERQQKQIDTLSAGLQKVSEQLELTKPAPQIVRQSY